MKIPLIKRIDFAVLFLVSCGSSLTAPTSQQQKIVAEEQARDTVCVTVSATRDETDACRAAVKKDTDAKLAKLLDGGAE